jgi:hypothetical protein
MRGRRRRRRRRRIGRDAKKQPNVSKRAPIDRSVGRSVLGSTEGQRIGVLKTTSGY